MASNSFQPFTVKPHRLGCEKCPWSRSGGRSGCSSTMLPEEHVVDSGYLNAEVLVSAEQRQKVTLIGPVAQDTSWQARDEHCFDKSQFSIDWQAQQVTCPQGKTSRYWIPTSDRHGKDVIHIKFNPADCKVCPSHGLCTQAQAGAR